MTIVHVVAISMIVVVMILGATSALWMTSYESGPYLFATGSFIEIAGYMVVVWTRDKEQ